jgi:tyrosine-protein phosphatase SIW14
MPTKRGLQELKKMGIAVVVDLRGPNDAERKEAARLGMEYVPLPWHCPFPNDAVFARLLTLLRENAGKKVFIHCRLGDDRAGMAIAAYRMAEQRWTAAEAMKEMQAYGFTWSHHFICLGLASYEKQFPEHWRSSPAFRGLRQDAAGDTAQP